MKWAIVFLSMAAVSCGSSKLDLRTDFDKKDQKTKDKPEIKPINQKDQPRLNLTVHDNNDNYLAQEDCSKVRPKPCFASRIVSADSAAQTVLVQYGYLETKASLNQFAPITHDEVSTPVSILLKGDSANTETMAIFTSETPDNYIRLNVEGDYCYLVFTQKGTYKTSIVRDYNCNMAVSK